MLRSIAASGVLKSFQLLSGILISIVLANALGPGAYGNFALASAVMLALAIPVDQSFRQLVTRTIAQGQKRQGPSLAFLQEIKKLASFYGLLVAIPLALCCFFLHLQTGSPVYGMLSVASLSSLLIAFIAIYSSVLRGEGRIAASLAPEALFFPLLFMSLAVLFSSKSELSGLGSVVLQFVCYGVTAILVYLMSRACIQKLAAQPSGTNVPAWKRSWMHITLVMIVTFLEAQLGIFILGLFSSAESVAGFRIALAFSQVPIFFAYICNYALGPKAARLLQGKVPGDVTVFLRPWIILSALFALVSSAVLVLYSEAIVGRLYGPEFTATAVTPLQILVAAQFVKTLFGPILLISLMNGYERLVLKSQILSIGINLVVISFTLNEFGAGSAAFAAAMGTVVGVLVLSWLMWKSTGVNVSVYSAIRVRS